jgi:RNA polymerase sigma-70 factor (sigma-E family)
MGERAGGLTREEVERRYVTGRDDLFRLAWLVVGDAGLAEDLVQEAYARLLVRPEQVREPERVDAYLRSIVLNLARTRWSRTTRRRRIDDRVHADPTGSARRPDADPMRGADDRELLRAALAELTTNQRACIVCRYWLGLTDAQTAESTGLSLGTVKTHLRRALSALRTDLVPPVAPTPEETHVHRP